MNLQKIKNLALIIILSIAQTTYAQITKQAKKPVHAVEKAIPLDPNVKMGKLPNGFTYFIRHNETPKDRAVFYLVNKVGSILETEEQRGLAHFMEHMSFNGTTNFPKNHLVDYLQKAGVRFGADLNAYTSFDETVYQLPIPTDQPELLTNALKIMRDWAHEALLDPAEIDKERGVILEEERLGKNVQARFRNQYFPVILNGSRYASRQPIGTDKVLKNFRPETIRKFYQDWYRPNLQALIVVGDVDVAAIENTIKATFGNLKNPAAEKVRTRYTIPLTGKNQFIALTDKEQTTTNIEVIIKHREQDMVTETDYRKLIVRSLYNQMIKRRYDEALIKADAPFLQGGLSLGGFLGGLDAFNLSVTAKPGALEKGFKASWRELVRLNQFGFTAPELERAKKSYLSSVESIFKEQNKTASEGYAKEYTQYFLKGRAAPGIRKEYELTKTAMADISLATVNWLTAVYLTTTNRDVLVTAPEEEKALLPNQLTVENWMKQVEQEKLEPYSEKTNTQGILANEPVPGKVVREEKNFLLNFTTLTLSNGMKVVLKPTPYKNDEIMFMAFANGGTSVYEDADYQSAANAGMLIPSGGVGNLNLNELGKYLSGKKVQVRPYISTLVQGMSGSAGNEDLSTALELIYAYFKEPRKDEGIFQNVMEGSKASISKRANDPGSVFQDSSLRVIYKNNFRMSGPTLEKLAQIKLDRSLDIYKDRFSDASNFTFVFVGSIDTMKIRPLLERYLASLPSTYKNEQFTDRNIDMATGRMEKSVYKGKEQKTSVNLMFSGSFDYSRENILQMTALKEVLQIRVLERLREEESGVYSPQVANSAAKYPKAIYQYAIAFGCAPENVDKLTASALDEIEKLKKSGPAQINIDKWKAEYVRNLETQMQTNNYWLSVISTQLMNNIEFQPMGFYKALMDKITPETLKEAANQYLSGSNYFKLVLFPEKDTK